MLMDGLGGGPWLNGTFYASQSRNILIKNILLFDIFIKQLIVLNYLWNFVAFDEISIVFLTDGNLLNCDTFLNRFKGENCN